ncbi:MAG: hypothetical protein AAF092_18475 [Pseudomonadota bacterium]
MADNVTNELLLEHLKAIRSEMSEVRARLSSVENEMRAVKGHLAVLIQADLGRDERIANFEIRLDRVERRLEISNGGEG